MNVGADLFELLPFSATASLLGEQFFVETVLEVGTLAEDVFTKTLYEVEIRGVGSLRGIGMVSVWLLIFRAPVDGSSQTTWVTGLYEKRPMPSSAGLPLERS